MDDTTPLPLILDDFEADDEAITPVDVIRDHIRGNTDIKTAANQLCDLIPNPDSDNWSCYLGGFWGEIIQVSEMIPYNHTAQAKLARLVARIRPNTKTMLLSESFTPAKPQWTQTLTSLGNLLRDLYLPPYDGCHNGTPAREWLNRTAFMANLYALVGIGMDFFCECQFETTFGVSVAEVERKMAKPTPTEARNLHVSAAAVWILNAGQTIFHTFLVPESLDEGDAAMKIRRQSEWGDMALWDLYRERFGAAAADEDLEEETRNLARRAGILMAAFSEAFSKGDV